jgi:hypothetical protein
MQTIVCSGKKGQQVMHIHTQESETAVFTYSYMDDRRVQNAITPQQAVASIPRGPGSAEITKAAAVRNVSNEGTATATTDRLVPNREDGGFAGDGESGGDGMLLLDGDVRCVVPYLA